MRSGVTNLSSLIKVRALFFPAIRGELAFVTMDLLTIWTNHVLQYRGSFRSFVAVLDAVRWRGVRWRGVGWRGPVLVSPVVGEIRFFLRVLAET